MVKMKMFADRMFQMRCDLSSVSVMVKRLRATVCKDTTRCAWAQI